MGNCQDDGETRERVQSVSKKLVNYLPHFLLVCQSNEQSKAILHNSSGKKPTCASVYEE
jgi:hypothetical protein